MTTTADSPDDALAGAGGRSGQGQIIIDSVVGQIVISADGLAPYVEDIVRFVIARAPEHSTTDDICGALVAAIANDERFGPSLSLATAPDYACSWSVSIRHHYPGRWLLASGPDPDQLPAIHL